MSIGEQLRASREARGLSIDAVAHTTRVQPRILAAIERDDVRGVPPRPFGRGFVKAYAREMGLDGDQMTRDYFAQFAPVVPVPSAAAETQTAPRASKPTQKWPLAMASVGAITAIAIAIVVSRPTTKNETTSAPAKVLGTSGTASAASTAVPKSTDAAPVVPAAARTAAPVAAPIPAAPLVIVLTATNPSWVTAHADGRRALYRTVTPGSPETITAVREVVIRVGNAGGLIWQINGREAGPMGRQGQIRDFTITPKTAATIR
jgi:cytoskeletal protein RodZ